MGVKSIALGFQTELKSSWTLTWPSRSGAPSNFVLDEMMTFLSFLITERFFVFFLLLSFTSLTILNLFMLYSPCFYFITSIEENKKIHSVTSSNSISWFSFSFAILFSFKFAFHPWTIVNELPPIVKVSKQKTIVVSFFVCFCQCSPRFSLLLGKVSFWFLGLGSQRDGKWDLWASLEQVWGLMVSGDFFLFSNLHTGEKVSIFASSLSQRTELLFYLFIF